MCRPPPPGKARLKRLGAAGAWRLRGWWRSGQQQNLWGFHAHFRKKLAFGWGVQQLRLLARTGFNILKWSTSRKSRKVGIFWEHPEDNFFPIGKIHMTWVGDSSSCGKGPPDLVISRWTQLTCSQCVEKLPYPVDLTWNIFTIIYHDPFWRWLTSCLALP